MSGPHENVSLTVEPLSDAGRISGQTALMRSRPAKEIALRKLEADLFADFEFFLALDAFGEGRDAEVADHGDQGFDELPLGRVRQVQIANHVNVEFQIIGRHLDQIDQPRLPGTKIVVGERNIECSQLGTQLFHRALIGDGRLVQLQSERLIREPSREARGASPRTPVIRHSVGWVFTKIRGCPGNSRPASTPTVRHRRSSRSSRFNLAAVENISCGPSIPFTVLRAALRIRSCFRVPNSMTGWK